MNNYRKDEFVGTTIYGYCNGFFGRYSYETKVIIASGKNWIVAQNDHDSFAEFASFGEDEDMEALIAAWSIEEEDED